MSLLTPEEKMSRLLKFIGNPSVCNGCGGAIYWVSTRRGGAMPVNHDGEWHGATCPKSREKTITHQKERIQHAYRQGA